MRVTQSRCSVILRVTDTFNFRKKVLELLPEAKGTIAHYVEFKYNDLGIDVIETSDQKQIVSALDFNDGRWPLPMEELMRRLPPQVSKILLFNLDMIIDEKDLG